MKVLMVSANYEPCIGGPASTVPYISRELGKLGHDVTILTQGAKGYDKVTEKEYYTIVRTNEEFPTVRDSFVQVIKLVYSLVNEINTLLSEESFDIVHAHDLNISSLSCILAGVHAPIVSKFTGDLALEYYCKILDVDTESLTLEEFGEEDSLMKDLLSYVQSWISDRVSLITVPSKFMQKTISENTGISMSNVRLFYNGCERVNYDVNRSSNVLFCAGHLETKKNFQLVIRALPRLPDYELLIAGEGSRREELESLCDDLNVSDRVTFLGRVSHESVLEHASRCFAFIVPSVYEPACVVLYDALCTSTPVIGTNVGGIPEIISDGRTGFIIEPVVSDLVDSVRLLEDDRAYELIQENQEEIVSDYYWCNHVEQDLIPIYEKMF